MTATGTEVADLTPVGSDDNDPEYLPDGRIVVKTDRFGAAPQVRIAVMNGDGTGLKQLTGLAGTSDHDPVSDGTYAVFERFNKGTDFSTDPEALFTAWDLVEVRLDGTGERILRHDAFINWLPVYSPDGRVLAYQRSAGYTDLRLLSRSGEDLGRWLPDITRVRYFDWK